MTSDWRSWRAGRGGLWAAPVLAAFLAFAAPVSAQEQSQPGGFTRDQIDGIERILHQYLLDNPEVLVESLTRYREQQEQAEKKRRQDAVIAHRSALTEDPGSPTLGNPDGDVIIVEFFDYNCPYCKRVADTLRQVVADDGNVRLVMKEFPILGSDSVQAARAALAAAKQGKYEPFHFALMSEASDLSQPSLMAIAGRVGLDLERLERDMVAPEIEDQLQRTYGLAEALAINGTPAFVIGDTLVPGAVDLETLRRLVTEARAKAS